MAMSKILIRLNDRFYITSSSYNPAILTRVSKPGDDDDRDVFDRDGLQRWYFQNYEDAIHEFAYQMARLDGDDGKDIHDLKTLAKVIDRELNLAKDQVEKQTQKDA